MRKYVLKRWYKDRIFYADVEKETEKTVWIKGSRTAKKSEYNSFYDSFEEAKAIAIKNLETNIGFKEAEINNLKENMKTLKSISIKDVEEF